LRYDFEMEEIVSSAKEKVGEAAEALEAFLPDTAEELSWIRESLNDQILRLRSAENESIDQGETEFDF